ncbi:MAG: DEAD/DEAH box helicase [Ureaplasma sp.]|nr:DEAD/DEAH box helicase [Ureaplasma sp.]
MYSDVKDWIKSQLKKDNISKFNEIQIKTWSKYFKNKNIIGISPTGTGKTLAFLLPILNNLELENKLQSIIISPTRELARQIYQKINEFKKFQPYLKAKLLIGGESIENQIESLKKTPQIIIATVDRLLEIIKQNYQNVNWSYLKSIVIDEADMLLDLGFFNQIDSIFNFLNDVCPNIQKLAFSATIHELLSHKLSKYFKNAEVINLSKFNQDKKIEHIIIDNNDKFHSLSVLLNKINPYFCLIFANKKTEVDEIYNFLKKQNRDVIKIHGDLTTRERRSKYKDIKQIKHQYVVCSDLLSRGLDIDGASHIINWNLSNDLEWYFHRAGRTGRGKYTGYSYILNDNKDIDTIMKLNNKGIEFSLYRIKNNDLVSSSFNPVKKQTKINDEQKNEI